MCDHNICWIYLSEWSFCIIMLLLLLMLFSQICVHKWVKNIHEATMFGEKLIYGTKYNLILWVGLGTRVIDQIQFFFVVNFSNRWDVETSGVFKNSKSHASYFENFTTSDHLPQKSVVHHRYKNKIYDRSLVS